MKSIFFFFFLIGVSPMAVADSSVQAISDGMTVTTIEKALSSSINGSNIKVTDYSKSWSSYNPMSWALDPNTTYRNISFEFTDKDGKKQKISCQATLKRTDTDFFIYNCSNLEGLGLRYFNKLLQYGYAEDSIIMENIVNKPSSGNGKASDGVR